MTSEVLRQRLDPESLERKTATHQRRREEVVAPLN
jgi:hypothetical protein